MAYSNSNLAKFIMDAEIACAICLLKFVKTLKINYMLEKRILRYELEVYLALISGALIY